MTEETEILVKTRIRIMRPGEPDIELEEEMAEEPGLKAIHLIVDPWLDGGDLEHVNVLASFDGDEKKEEHLDMFVDEIGLQKNLPRNEAATAMYRRAWLKDHPEDDPEELDFVVGPAILFDRRVWV